MTESHREPVPRDDAGERATALAFLGFQRRALVKKTAGLDEEKLRRELVPTGTNLLGLVQHMIVGERWWFRHHVAGELLDEEFDFGMAVPRERGAAEVLAEYRAAVAASDAVIDRTAFDDLTALPVDDEPRTLRWVVAHVITETARHAGHADILRELIDGTTGR